MIMFKIAPSSLKIQNLGFIIFWLKIVLCSNWKYMEFIGSLSSMDLEITTNLL